MKAFQNWPALVAALVAAVLSTLGNRQFPPASPPPTAPAPIPPHPEPPPPPAPPPPTSKPLEAIGRLVMQGGYCSATVVSAPDKDGRQVLLSAAHCAKAVGDVYNFFPRSGSMVPVRVLSINREADACLLETDSLRSPLPYLLVAAETPAEGSKVFHAGFGIDNPGNVETGTILQRDTGAGQVMFSLSVSPGDSGGGICLDSSGAVVSPVCCTTRLAARGQVFGARPEVVHRMMKQPAAFVDVPPQQMPMR